MKRPGKPDTGNPSVRFDEGSESDGHWLTPFNPSAPAYSTTGFAPIARSESCFSHNFGWFFAVLADFALILQFFGVFDGFFGVVERFHHTGGLSAHAVGR